MLTGRQIPRFWRNNLLIKPLHFCSTKKGIIQLPDMQITTRRNIGSRTGPRTNAKSWFAWFANQGLRTGERRRLCSTIPKMLDVTQYYKYTLSQCNHIFHSFVWSCRQTLFPPRDTVAGCVGVFYQRLQYLSNIGVC